MGTSEILTLVVTVLGTAVSTLFAYRTLEQRRTKRWWSIVSEVGKLNRFLKTKEIDVDVIVSFSNGGLIAADLLHIKHLHNVPILSLVIRRQSAITGPQKLTVEGGIAPHFLRGKRVLVIDDVVNHGDTLTHATEFLESQLGVAPDKIITAALGHRRGEPNFKAHYMGFEYRDQIRLPWGSVPRD